MNTGTPAPHGWTAETIPAPLVAILDEQAGKEHSATGSVRQCLADILNEYDRAPDDLAARIRADWDTLDSRRRMVNGTLTDLAVRMEKMAASLLLPADDAIEAARLDAARYAWLAAADMAREGIADA